MPAEERRRTADDDRRRRGPLLPDEVHAQQGHRVRHRRGAELRGRERPVPAVLGGPGPQHLRQAGRARRPVRGRRCVAQARRDADRRRSTPATTATSCGAWCSKRRGSTRSSTRRCGRSSCRSLAKYAFSLAQAFNALLPPLADPERGARAHRLWRAAVISAYRRQLTARARPDGRRRAGADVRRACDATMPTTSRSRPPVRWTTTSRRCAAGRRHELVLEDDPR